jgi:two-component system chemotaxis response regulator CheY
MVKILIVDDSIFSQKITANLIKKVLSNAEIFFANDGQEGLEKYKNIKPDYTFLDLLMPKLNGKELLMKIKEIDNEAKVIVVSADVQKSVKREMEAFDVMMFINKPFNEEKALLICEMIRNDENE